VFSGTNPEHGLVEFVELPRDVHPFYVGTQAHPELRSRPNRAHPLFRGLVGAALDRQNATRLFEVEGADEAVVAEPAEV
jgi:CTP synthase